VDEDLWMSVPPSPCAIPGLAARVAQAIGMPAGIEHAPGSCGGSPGRTLQAERVALRGLTAREALDRLITFDPRYYWMDTDGVIVVRPRNAWADASHFLNRTATSFHLDAANFAAALRAIQSALGAASANPEPRGGRTPQGSQAISVHLDTAVSAYESLNSVVRAHGAMRWRVTYCASAARHEFATMWMETYDGSGLGSHAAVLRDDRGKSFDACRPQRS
jgi:hypothetical protein